LLPLPVWYPPACPIDEVVEEDLAPFVEVAAADVVAIAEDIIVEFFEMLLRWDRFRLLLVLLLLTGEFWWRWAEPEPRPLFDFNDDDDDFVAVPVPVVVVEVVVSKVLDSFTSSSSSDIDNWLILPKFALLPTPSQGWPFSESIDIWGIKYFVWNR
jgi:hypothetical protein